MNEEITAGSHRRARHALLSAALGISALMLVLAAFVVMQNNQDIRPVFMVAYGAFFAAGFFSARRNSAFGWTAAIGVALGGILPGLALRVSGLAFTDLFYAIVMAAIAVVAVFLGGIARALVFRRRALALAFSCVALAAALAAALAGIPRLLDTRAYTETDRPIEPFALRTLDGESISSDSWHGRVVVLSYWATWCPPCLSEIPEISALQKKYQGDSRVAVVAVNAGYGGDTPQKARDFLVRRHFDIVTAIDDVRVAGSTKGEGAVHMGLKVVPTLFILNKNHRLVALHVGYDGSEHLAATLSHRIDSMIASAP